MPATVPAIDRTLFNAINTGSERAFQQLFRAQYSALLNEATPLLDGDAASAARGVESVFVQIWKGRGQFDSPQALETYLHEALHEAAARIKSRHAVAHQLGEFEGAHAHKKVARPAPDVDQAWAKLYGLLNVDQAHAAAVANEIATHSRHEAAGQIVEIAKPRPKGQMILMGVLIVAMVAGIAWWTNKGKEAVTLNNALAASDARPSATGMAEFSNVTLADKSTVKLGPDSKMLVPRGFGTSVRGLKLDGTATFTVAPGQNQRFIVRAGAASIIASGTAFTVRAYPDEKSITVRVSEGSVTATVAGVSRTVASGAAILIGADSVMREPTTAEVEEATGWADGNIVAARPLRDILVIARRWFGLPLLVADTALLSRKVALRAPVGNATDALKSIETSGHMKRVWEGTNMVLRDGQKR